MARAVLPRYDTVESPALVREFRRMTSPCLGIAAIVTATVMWGFSPLYYALLNHVPPFEVVAHRILWSVPPILLYALATGRRARFLQTGRDRRKMLALTLAAACTIVNLFTFIVAIQTGHTSEASFGYYVYPLAALILGVLVFGERLSRAQILAACIAFLGILWLGLRFGQPPWIALIVMSSFALYGVIRKAAEVGPLVGVLWELLLATPFLIAWLVWTGGGMFGESRETTLLLIGSSLFTGIPLVLFVEAAKRLRFSTVGVLFYINPTLQVVSAILLGEAFGWDRAVGFLLIWIAVALYCAELIRQDRRARTDSIAASAVSTTS